MNALSDFPVPHEVGLQDPEKKTTELQKNSVEDR